MTETKHKEHITSEHFGIPADFADRAENYAAWRVQALSEQLAEAQALIKVQMSNVKISEPIGTICFDGGIWDQNWVSNQDAYSEEQLKQYGDDRAKEALEMAAKLFEPAITPTHSVYAKTIRALANGIK